MESVFQPEMDNTYETLCIGGSDVNDEDVGSACSRPPATSQAAHEKAFLELSKALFAQVEELEDDVEDAGPSSREGWFNEKLDVFDKKIERHMTLR